MDNAREREAALLAYAMTVAQRVRGFRSVDDLVGRLTGCVRADAVNVAADLGRLLATQAVRVVEQRAREKDVVGQIARGVEGWIMRIGGGR